MLFRVMGSLHEQGYATGEAAPHQASTATASGHDQAGRVHAGQRQTPWIVWYKLPLEKAPEAYANFDQRKNGWTQVVLKPGKSK